MVIERGLLWGLAGIRGVVTPAIPADIQASLAAVIRDTPAADIQASLAADIQASLAADIQASLAADIQASLAVVIRDTPAVVTPAIPAIPAAIPVGDIPGIQEEIQDIQATPVATQGTQAIPVATRVAIPVEIRATLEVAGRGPILPRRIYGSSITCRASMGAKGRRLAKLLMVACPLLSRTWPRTASSLACHRVRARMGV